VPGSANYQLMLLVPVSVADHILVYRCAQRRRFDSTTENSVATKKL
jgi:hypothetical protein